MPLYNLISHSKNYQKTTASLWNYYRDKPNSGLEGDVDYSIKNSKSFHYKTKLVGTLADDANELDGIKVTVPVTYLSKFFRSLEILLTNCEICLDLKWN